MEYQNIANLLDSRAGLNTSNQPSKFRPKIGLKQMMKREEHTVLIDKLILKHQS